MTTSIYTYIYLYIHSKMLAALSSCVTPPVDIHSTDTCARCDIQPLHRWKRLVPLDE